MFSYSRMCSLTIESVLLLQKAFSYRLRNEGELRRMCSLAIEGGLLLQTVFLTIEGVLLLQNLFS